MLKEIDLIPNMNVVAQWYQFIDIYLQTKYR